MRYALILFILLRSYFAQAQFGVDVGLSSQTSKTAYEQKFQNFGGSVSARFYGKGLFFKVIFRQSIPKAITTEGYTKVADTSAYDNERYITIEQLDVKFKETTVGFGFGITFPRSKSKTRPYLTMDYARSFQTIYVKQADYDRVYSDHVGQYFDKKNLKGAGQSNDCSQFRLGAGIQFEIKRNLLIYNEAYLNWNTWGGVYYRSKSIDLGIRLCI